MELTEKITLDMLTANSVSVVVQKYINYNGIVMPIGDITRNTYMNTVSEREFIKTILPNEYYNAVMAVWGNQATVDEPIIE
ncbi:MAG: hypothetical protein U0L20_08320 [Ruminococcus sp.]|nr:hypothetical protein [Ruminococcus sp.]